MNDRQDHLYAKDVEHIQITYGEYAALMNEKEHAEKLDQVRQSVANDLLRLLDPESVIQSEPEAGAQTVPNSPTPVAAEYDSAAEQHEAPDPEEQESEQVNTDTPVPAGTEESTEPQVAGIGRTGTGEVPPIKQEIAEHFNACDESGRLFNIFKQYYTCLNETCGGTVRVTIKDGFCSLWNYDQWEEFAWIDTFEESLRISMDPKYTDELKSLSLCDTPRLISTRRDVIAVQVGDLNNAVLEVLAKAFNEAGVHVN